MSGEYSMKAWVRNVLYKSERVPGDRVLRHRSPVEDLRRLG